MPTTGNRASPPEPPRELREALRRSAAGDFTVRTGGGAAVLTDFDTLMAHVERLVAEASVARRALAEGLSELLSVQRRLAHAERLAALGAMSARLAHELGTPLHSVAGHLDLLLQDPELPDESRRRAGIVAGEVDRLCTLIRNQLTRVRSPLPDPQATDLNALVERITILLRPLCGARAVELHVEFGPGAGEPFVCDPVQIEQVLLNLVQNALDAMQDGGTLTLRTAVADDGRVISVCDSGCGIRDDVSERIFEPFFSTKKTGRGTGLGLSLCREIALHHGGDIVIESKEGVGTAATLILGRIRPEDDA